jgi:uncharacterized protein (TIGR03435 family)
MENQQRIKKSYLSGNWRPLCGVAVFFSMIFLNSICLARSQGTPRSDGPNANLPKFDAVSIRPSGNVSTTMLLLTPDGISATNVPLHLILRQAFGVEDDRLVGIPGWADNKRYDIQAKVTADDAPALKKISREQRFAMLQPVLQERFQLKFHHQTRELQGYALVVAKGGPKIKEYSPETPTGTNSSGQRHLSLIGNGRLESKGTQIASLAHELSFILGGQTVADKTGLTGSYDYTLQWAPDNGNDAQSSTDSAPSIFTALQEQLGLRLESEKVQADVVVIDRIEPPTAN